MWQPIFTSEWLTQSFWTLFGQFWVKKVSLESCNYSIIFNQLILNCGDVTFRFFIHFSIQHHCDLCFIISYALHTHYCDVCFRLNLISLCWGSSTSCNLFIETYYKCFTTNKQYEQCDPVLMFSLKRNSIDFSKKAFCLKAFLQWNQFQEH